MNEVPQPPNLKGGSRIVITRRETFALDCPKCKKPLDVTDLAFGTNIECPSCQNITWRPEHTPKWWFRLRNLFLANLLSFILGIIASIVGTWIYSEYEASSPTVEPETKEVLK